ncbi:MAG: 50S ribosomal protein L3 [Chlamydiia bacterium]|nr:50S ribosomal protein L3 [Chlamydiia bacterium]MCH9616549.1 50S ribosomal protein L3 [Chlamydiia bacterium]
MRQKSMKLMGRKQGMTRIFDEHGFLIPCTVISIEPNVVVQKKTVENDGYEAYQMGFDKVADSKKRNVTKPLVGHYAKSKVEPRKHLQEADCLDEFEVGQEVGVEYFEGVKFLDATAQSKGKGFQGVMKRHNFSGGPAAHGSGFHRHAGSTGMRSTPGRTLQGHKMPGQMGNKKVTTEGLEIIKIDVEKQVVLVRGSVPGGKNGLVSLRKALKKEGK